MLSKTLPISLSRRLMEEHNNNSSKSSSFPSSPQSYSSSRSISPEPTFDSIISEHSLHRKPTFSYIPIDTRRRSLIFSRPTSLSLISTSIPSQHSSASTTSNLSSTLESEMPTTPTSLCSSSSDQSVEYTSFPNLEKFADECWTEIRVEKDNICDIEMEPYDEMFVAGVRFQYS